LGVDGQPDPEVFALTRTALADLAADDVHAKSRVLAYQARLLVLHGLGPQLDVCAVSGDACPPGRPAYFDPARGAIVRRRYAGEGHLLVSAVARTRLRAALRGELGPTPWPEDAQAGVAALLQAHVRAQLGKDLGGADALARDALSPRR
ncbi:MAG: DNA repair protein RecO C-terminal domain-containing protein, partial [Myxococcota bacterium]